jgi:diguanylate cyclase (GGDEF)-like protein
MIELIRAKDWSQTPLGPLASWPGSLRTTVSLTLASSFPMSVIWGDGAVQLWNEAYTALCGKKHPAMFGSDYRECWASAWDALGGAFDAARAGSTAFLENQPMFLDRHGYLEETWFTLSLSPIRGERGEVAGLLLPVVETTVKMLSERRNRTLRELSSQIDGAGTRGDAIARTIAVLAEAHLDVPVALVYLLDEQGTHARLHGQTGVSSGSPLGKRTIGLDDEHAVAVSIRERSSVMVEDVVARYGAIQVADRDEALERVLVLPIIALGDDRAAGALVLGVSTRLRLDDSYRGFLELVGQSVTGSLMSAHARDQERARVAALAELDRAKTEFFSNVSHEFRTPLTLMLGPLEDELAQGGGSPDRNDKLAMVHRNGLRLLRLVNSLLDFSRIESGNVQASFRSTDLSAFTADLAGSFRSAVEEANLRFTVDCHPLPEQVFVDQDMWERIVLNLLSNAFKHTFEGEIAVSLQWRHDHAELTVRDTGVGIPASELPRLFDRFHRVKDARSRTIEGTGIGLAVVQELAHRHGGDVRVESREGRGSTFAVTVRGGRAHLLSGDVREDAECAPTSNSVAAMADEALRWVVDSEDGVGEHSASLAPRRSGHEGRPRVLLADDNADMRRYVAQMLDPNYEVMVVADGRSALEAARNDPPALVITDVMMPRLDGFGLLSALREDTRTKSIPVIMLSARAGAEASLEGVRAGVDDYLVKPFSGEDLLARVSRSIALADLRRESEQQLTTVNNELEVALAHVAELSRTDVLTGLPNRRAWDQELARELARASRQYKQICVALMDLDHLKLYNDSKGHRAGDSLLIDAGAAWRKSLRISDLLARIGGDEFAVLMPECRLEDAERVIERMCAATPNDQSCSAGIACWDGRETGAALVSRADVALYAVKRARCASATVAR